MPAKKKGAKKTTKCVKYYKVCNKSAYVKGRKVNVYKNKTKAGYFYKKLVNGKASYRKLKTSQFKKPSHKKVKGKRVRKTTKKLTKRSKKVLTGVTKKIKKLSSQLSKLKKQKSKIQKKLRFGGGGFGTGGEAGLYQMMGPTLSSTDVGSS